MEISFFSQPRLPLDNALVPVSFDEWLGLSFDEASLPSYPQKNLKQILDLVRDERSNQVHIFEWLSIIEDQAQWGALPQDEQIASCLTVWKAILTNNLLAKITLFKVAQVADGRSAEIVSQITNSLEIAHKAKFINDSGLMAKVGWIVALQQQNYDDLAYVCYQHKQTVPSILKAFQLPRNNSYQGHVIEHICSMVHQGDINFVDDRWLADNAKSLTLTAHSTRFWECFIQRFNTVSYGEFCEDQVRQQCLPDLKNSLWSQLSVTCQDILALKFKLSQYFGLKAVSRALYSDEAAEVLEFTESEQRQIRSRSMFWDNYSTHIKRARALLPKPSYEYAVAHNGTVPPFVKMAPANITNVEVYIFEIGQIIAVEFLRGSLSELRIFKASNWNRKLLLESDSASHEEIRKLPQAEVHDHIIGWQYFCEKLLRERFKLVPNATVEQFKGLPPEVSSYSFISGLPKPAEEILLEREPKLSRWLEEFWSNELQSGKLAESLKGDQPGNKEIIEAMIAKQRGKTRLVQQKLSRAAEKSNPEAMWQLGKSLLLGRNNSPDLRKQGETWVAKAAGLGHVEAKETTDKFGIQPISNDLDRCLSLLSRVSEPDILKGVKLASCILKNTERLDQDKPKLITRLFKIMESSNQSEVRVQISNALENVAGNNLKWRLITALRAKGRKERIKAIQLMDELYWQGEREGIPGQVEKIVKEARRINHDDVVLAGLSALAKFGNTVAQRELNALPLKKR
ncbi:hypothetical protein K0504_04590 [Neiella marina]|uniref:Zorya protein ZorC EH domain-containing protein n=1 Tax=Neiella holothuriorum TaxID=2870530 RepID=A0ABS7ED94_9GAMM|nr:EH signature domain-containing protein [Neiella holothuriorum]MBW8190307.1 hypothetical protein [Neiella holothuriorum]